MRRYYSTVTLAKQQPQKAAPIWKFSRRKVRQQDQNPLGSQADLREKRFVRFFLEQKHPSRKINAMRASG